MATKTNSLRLQKYLADMGVCSRRTAEVLIRDGSIMVNGKIAQIGDKIEPGIDEVIYEGQRIRHRKPKRRRRRRPTTALPDAQSPPLADTLGVPCKV